MEKFDGRVRDNLVAALRETNKFKPGANNWVLFASTVKAAFRWLGVEHDAARLAAGLHDHEGWYVGDGTYGDGPRMHWDYLQQLRHPADATGVPGSGGWRRGVAEVCL